MSLKLEILRGYKNKIVGSTEYFDELNSKTIFDDIIPRSKNNLYHSGIIKYAVNAKNILDIIYRDLLKYENEMWLIDKSKKRL